MLWRKLIRDLWENRGANIACVVVIAIGVMSFNAFHMAVNNLDSARLRFYAQNRFADGFATVKEMPVNRLRILEDIPEITQVQGQLRQDVTVYMPEWGQNLTLRLVSMDPEDALALNRVNQVAGPGLINGSRQEVLLGLGFMEAHGIQAGDVFQIIYNGRLHTLTVAGGGQSPEFVYLMPDEGSWFADAATFDVAFMTREALEDLLGRQGMINEISFALEDGVDFDRLSFLLEERLSPYGLINLVEAEDQISNFMVEQEIQGVSVMSNTLPGMFIVVAVLILYLILRRMVEQQRTQIGTMKAFGVTSLEIMTHYSWYGGILGVMGGLLGSLLGLALAGGMTQMYGQYFHLPDLNNNFYWEYVLLGLVVSILPCLLASFMGARRLLKLEPAQAMQPPTPKAIKKTLVERMVFFWKHIGMLGRMAVRNIFRNRGRSLFAVTGTMFAFVILWIILSFSLITDLMVMNQVYLAQKYDLRVTMKEMQPPDRLINDLQHLEGVELAEAMIQVPVKLRYGGNSYDTAITCLDEKAQLYGILDKGANLVQMPSEGLLLSGQVADKLNVRSGQRIYIDSDLWKEPKEVYISGVVEQYFGMESFMALRTLDGLADARVGAAVAMIKATDHSGVLSRLEETLLLAPGVAGVENKNTIQAMYEEMMEPMNAAIVAMVIVGMITAFAVIYASATVSLSERQREISSAKVLGMTDYEVMVTLGIENGILTLGGILLGIPMSKWAILAMMESFTTDLYSMPARLDPMGFFNSLYALMTALALSLWAMRRRIKNLELAEVLKTRD